MRPPFASARDVVFVLVPAILLYGTSLVLGVSVVRWPWNLATLVYLAAAVCYFGARYLYTCSFDAINYGVMVRRGEYSGSLLSLSNELENVIQRFQRVGIPARDLIRSEPLWVAFETTLTQCERPRRAKLFGFIPLGGDAVTVHFPLSYGKVSDFRHAIAHVIITRKTSGWSPSAQHRLIKSLGLD